MIPDVPPYPSIFDQPSTLEAQIDYPFAFTRTYLGLNSTVWTQFVFSAKAQLTDADSAAIMTVQVTNPPDAGEDGLTILNGAPPVSPVVKADASLVISTANVYGQAATTVTLAVDARGMGIANAGSYFWSLTAFFTNVKQPEVDGGQLLASGSVYQDVSQA